MRRAFMEKSATVLIVLLMLLTLGTVFLTPPGSTAELRSRGSLPEPLYNGAAAYDGDDLIYYFGGVNATGVLKGEVQVYRVSTGASWTEGPFEPLRDTSAAYVNGKFYVFGGEHSTLGYRKLVLEYDPASGNTVAVATFPYNITNTAVAVAEDKVYIFGGYDHDNNTVSKDVFVFTAGPNTLKRPVFLPMLPDPRMDASAVFTGTYFYVFGGYSETGVPSNTIYRYNAVNGSCAVVKSIANSGRWEVSMPEPRADGGATYVNGSVYYYGGVDSSFGERNTIFKFNPVSLGVVRLSEGLSRGSANICTVKAENSTYILGGYSASGGAQGQVVKHTPTNLHLAMQIYASGNGFSGIPTAKSTAVYTGELIYLFGGRTSSTVVSDIYRYDPLTSRKSHEGNLVFAVCNAASVWYGDRAWIFGGKDDGGSYTNTVQYYIPSSGTSDYLVGTILPSKIASWEAVVYGDCAYMFGGKTLLGYSSDIVCFNFTTETVSVVGTLPYPVAEYTLGVRGGTAYIMGGMNSTHAYIDDIIELDLSRMSGVVHWDVIPVSVRKAFGGYSSMDGNLHIIGGDISVAPYNSTLGYIIDPDTMSVDVSSQNMRRPLSDGSSVSHDWITLFGGYSTSYNPVDWIVTYRNDEITSEGKFYDAEIFYDTTLTNGAAAVYQETMYVFGGIKDGAPTNEVYRVTAKGRLLTVNNFPLSIYDAAAVTVNDRIYIFGGVLAGGPSSAKAIWVYYPSNNTLLKSPDDLPYPVAGAAASNDGMTAYVVGGYNGTTIYNSLVEVRQGFNHTISFSGAGVKYPVSYVYDAKVYFAGGETASELSRDVMEYDPSSGQVKTVGRLPFGISRGLGGGGGGILLLAGGRTNFGLSDFILMYDISRNDTELAGMRLGTAVENPCFAMGGNYIIGGNGVVPIERPLRSFFEPEDRSWERLEYEDGLLPGGISNAPAVFNGTHAFIFGGIVDGAPSNEIWRYEAGTRIVTDPTSLANLPGAFEDMSAAYDPVRERVYLTGGRSAGSPTAVAYEYDIKNDTVSNMPVGTITARSGHGSVMVNGHDIFGNMLFYFAGENGVYLDDVMYLDPKSSNVPYHFGNLPQSMAYFGYGYDGDDIYLFGGESGGGLLDTIYRIDLDTRNISRMNSRLPAERKYCTAVWDDDHGVFDIFGGINSTGHRYDEILIYDPAGDVLTLAHKKLPTPVSAPCAVYDASIVFGGDAGPGGGDQLNRVIDYIYAPTAPDGDDVTQPDIDGQLTLNTYYPHTYSYDLVQVSTLSTVLNHQLQVNQEYRFVLEVGHFNGFSEVDVVNITAWFDEGVDPGAYNITSSGTGNFFFQYRNDTSTGNVGVFRMLWPTKSSEISNFWGEELSAGAGITDRKILRFHFTPMDYFRWADGVTLGNDPPDLGRTWSVGDALNNNNSWNFQIRVTDSNGNTNDTYDEFGVFKYQTMTVFSADPYLDAAPGTPQTQMETTDPSDVTRVVTRINAPFRLLVNISDLVGPGTIAADNVALDGGDLPGITSFAGPTVDNSTYYRASSSTWLAHYYAPAFGDWNTTLTWYVTVPPGVAEGTYTGYITYMTQTSATANRPANAANTPPEPPRNPFPPSGGTATPGAVALRATVSDVDSGSVFVRFYNATSGAEIGSVSTAVSGSGTDVSMTYNIGPNWFFQWYVTVDDGEYVTTSPTWNFNTVS